MRKRKKTILLVEDEVLIAMGEQMTLETNGYRVVLASSGEDAIKAVETTPGIDLILMDIDLGEGIDGTEAAAIILQDRDLPVVFLSSHTEPEIVEKTEKITSYGYIVKGCKDTILLASIKMALRLYAANMKVAESDNRLKSMLEVVPDMVSIHDPEMNILYSNWRGFADIPETKRLTNTKCYKTYRNLDEICPDCLAKNVLETGQPIKKDTEIPEGLWVDVRAIPILDANNQVTMFIEWVRDITEAKQNEIALIEKDEKLESILDNLTDVVWSLSYPDLKLTFISPASNRIFGYEPLMFTQNPMLRTELTLPDDRQVLEQVILDLEEKGVSRREYRIVRPDGEIRYVVDRCRLVYGENKTPIRIDGITTDITERKQAEQDLVHQKDLLESIINGTQDILAIQNPDLSIARYNEAGYQLLGKTHDEIVGKKCYELIGRKRECKTCATRQALLTKKIETVEHPIPELNIYLNCRANPVLNRDGNVVQVVQQLRDITERKQAEEALRESEEKHRRLFETMTQGAVYHEADGTISSANPAAERILGRTLDQMRDKTSMDPRWRMIKEDGTAVPGTDHPAMIALLTGKTVGPVIRGVFHPDKNDHVWLSITAVPLFQPGGTQPFQVYAAFDDITERERAEGRLKERERFLTSILETTQDGFWGIDSRKSIIEVNEAYCRMSGYSRDELLMLKINDVDATENHEETDARLLRIMKNGSETFETKHRCKDGSLLDIEVSGSWLDMNGGIFVCFSRDISGRKRATEALLDSEQRLVTAQRLAKTGDFTWNVQTGMVHWSDTFYELMQYDPLETIDYTRVNREMHHPEDLERVTNWLNDAILSGTGVLPPNEYRLIRRDGKTIFVRTIGLIKPNTDGQLEVFAAIQDITEQKQAEATLRENERWFQDFLQNVPDIVYRFSNKQGGVFWSNRTCDALGYDPDELKKDPHLWNRSIHPDDQTAVEKAIQDYEKGGRYNIDYRIKTKDGRWIWLNDCFISKTVLGDEIIIEGYATDITRRKEAEESLKNERHRLANIIEGTNTGTWEWHIQTGETTFNERWAEIIGYTLDEISPVFIDTWTRFTHPDDLKTSNERLEKIFSRESDYYECEARMRHKNGDWIWVLDRGKVVNWTDDGKPLLMAGTHQDITERKRAEEELQQMSQILENADSIAVLKDPSLRYLAVNQAYLRLSGWKSAADVVGKTDRELFKDIATEEQIAAYMENDRTALKLPAGQVITIEEFLPAEDGSQRTFLTKKFPVYDQKTGTVLSVATLTAEITDRKQAEETIQRQLQEKEILLRETHHRIKNNVSAIASLLRLQSKSAKNPEAAAILKETIGRVHSMAELYDKMLLSSDYRNVPAAQYLGDLADSAVALFDDQKRVTVKKQLDDVLIDAKKLFLLGIVTNELLTNVMKYAFVGREAGTIEIAFTKTGAKATLTIEDDGVGLPGGLDVESSERFGLMLVRMLAQQLEGTFSIESHQGTRSVLEFAVH
jgi:PAS domain S-box-containing protein